MEHFAVGTTIDNRAVDGALAAALVPLIYLY